jgi:hypothetical protein
LSIALQMVLHLEHVECRAADAKGRWISAAHDQQ